MWMIIGWRIYMFVFFGMPLRLVEMRKRTDNCSNRVRSLEGAGNVLPQMAMEDGTPFAIPWEVWLQGQFSLSKSSCCFQ